MAFYILFCTMGMSIIDVQNIIGFDSSENQC